MTIGSRIKSIREDNDGHQKEIAALLGIKQQMYSNYERGIHEVPVRHLAALAEFYNLSLDYLACLIDEPRPLHRPK